VTAQVRNPVQVQVLERVQVLEQDQVQILIQNPLLNLNQNQNQSLILNLSRGSRPPEYPATACDSTRAASQAFPINALRRIVATQASLRV
jgi:hypothetical protein